MSQRTNQTLIGAILIVAAVAWGIIRFRPQPDESASNVASTNATETASPMISGANRPDRNTSFEPPEDPELMSQVFDLEMQLEERDSTVWALEIESQKYEDVFVDFWDELRFAESPEKALGDLAFDQLILGQASRTNHHEWNIRQVLLEEDGPALTHDQWKSFLEDWAGRGYRLETSEWRHRIWDPPTDSKGAHSVFQVSLLVEHEETNQRITIRGPIDVQWKPLSDETATPEIETVDARQLTLIHREAPPPFNEHMDKVLMPFTNSIFIGPVMADDLNRDGLPEIIFGTRNVVYWNRGDGNLEAGTLLRYRPEKPYTMMLADMNGDGAADMVSADEVGLEMYPGEPDGTFPHRGISVWDAPQVMNNPFVMTSGDVDGDGDLDVWVAQYKIPYAGGQFPTPYFDANDGFPAYLLLNDGTGKLTDATESSGLAEKRYRRTYSSSFVDLDGDHDLDLMVVSDFAGVDVYLNDGKGTFRDVTSTFVDIPQSMGMAHTFGDYNLDGLLDFFVIGMTSYPVERMDHLGIAMPGFPESYQEMRSLVTYGSRMYFNTGDGFQHGPMSDQIARTGWSWGATTADFDNDGDPDVIVNNGQISRESTRDYESQFWRHDIYLGDSELDPVLGVYFPSVQTRLFGQGYSYRGNEMNQFYLNESGTNFLECAWQMGMALTSDLRSILTADLDADGRLDVVTSGFEPWPAMQSGFNIHLNRWDQTGNWIGLRLDDEGPGLFTVGTKVEVHLSNGRTIPRQVVNGDSYRSQEAPILHFGLGGSTVNRIEIRWPDGTAKELKEPEINRYHLVSANDGAVSSRSDRSH